MSSVGPLTYFAKKRPLFRHRVSNTQDGFVSSQISVEPQTYGGVSKNGSTLNVHQRIEKGQANMGDLFLLVRKMRVHCVLVFSCQKTCVLWVNRKIRRVGLNSEPARMTGK